MADCNSVFLGLHVYRESVKVMLDHGWWPCFAIAYWRLGLTDGFTGLVHGFVIHVPPKGVLSDPLPNKSHVSYNKKSLSNFSEGKFHQNHYSTYQLSKFMLMLEIKIS
jgi:hypothetical protein